MPNGVPLLHPEPLVVSFSAYRENPEEAPRRLAMAASLGGRHLALWGANTRAEAELAVNMLDGTTELTLVTSGYHMRRAFLTVLKVLQEKKLDRIVHLHCRTVDNDAHPTDIERQKIMRYRALGHVALESEAIAYIHWLEIA